jgi:Family of unknown function (DUF6527)
MPTLRELEARFISYTPEGDRDVFTHVDSLAEAHGIHFLCPKSFAANHGPVGTHMVQVYFAGSPVPAHMGKNKNGQTVRWYASGNGLENLSLTPSIQEEDDICKWHGFVGSSGVAPGSAQ